MSDSTAKLTSNTGKSEESFSLQHFSPGEATNTGESDDGNHDKSIEHIGDSMPLGQQIIFVGVVCTAQLTTQMGFGQVIPILHIIGDSLGVTQPETLAWLVAGYSLTTGTFILIAGRFGDVFGYKKMFIIGMVWYALWSLIAGMAVWSNFVLFVFARVLQGLGPAMLLPNGLAILGISYSPGTRKNMAFAAFGACAPSGGIAGTLFGSLWTLIWWPWTFWTFAIALLCLSAVGAVIIPPTPHLPDHNLPMRQKVRNLDLPGAVAGVTALVLINLAWNQAPIVGWEEPYVYVILILGFLAILIFFLIEYRFAPVPLIPFKALSGDVAFVLGCVACGWASFGTYFFYLWQHAETVRMLSPILSTAYFVPGMISGAAASAFVGMLMGRVRASWIMMFSMLFFITGCILVATLPRDQTYWAQFFVSTIITPWGMDMSFPAATIIFSNAVPRKLQGMGASLVLTVVNYSISLGLGFSGTAEAYVKNGGTSLDDVVRGHHAAMYTAIGCAGLGVLLSLIFLIKDYFWKPN